MEHDAGPTSFTGFENKAFYNMMYCITVADHPLFVSKVQQVNRQHDAFLSMKAQLW